jgi:hypothetical protein
MTRSSFFVPTIVVSALVTGLLLPFACAGGALPPGFGSAPSDDDDDGDVDPNGTPVARADASVEDCPALLVRTCGGCTESASCEAATLLARYEPARCTAALDDEQKFPECTARQCEGLMLRVCGATTPTEACASNPGCGPATVLYERSTSSSSSTAEIEQADASCAAALTDDAVFAPCDG